jgi:hypothetical protein
MDGPSLGPLVIKWMENVLAAPDRTDGEMFRPTDEQRDFINDFYALDLTGKRVKRRAVLSRPKGWGKSPALGAIAAAEGLGPVIFDHWAEEGEVFEFAPGLGMRMSEGDPVGKPWRTIRTPLVQVSAVSEDQTRNCWGPLLEMLSDGPAKDIYPGLEPMSTFVALPGGGRIEFVTASARSREGNRPVFCVLDQTETWLPSNGGVKLAATMRRNLGKTGGSSIESPNAYLPGEDSVAEQSAKYWDSIEQGKARDDGLLYDHREAPADTELTDKKSLLAGLRYAYGCASAMKCVLPGHKHGRGWVDLERIVAEIWDPATDPQDARRFYLNQITHASDSYISAPDWAGCLDEEKQIQRGDIITLGFDGSRGKAKGKPDATALIGCRVSDGHIFTLEVWEADDGPGEENWEPPIPEIHAAVADAFKQYRVAAFYCDPAKDWRSIVNEWENKYSRRPEVQVKVTPLHPFEWWMTGGRSVFIERAVEAFEGAVRNGDMTHSGGKHLTQHVLNARRRIRHQKLTLGKEHDYSSRKIDACVAAVLAWQARMDCVAKGVQAKRKGRLVRVR